MEQLTQPTTASPVQVHVDNKDWMEKNWWVIIVGAAAMYYFKVLEPLQIIVLVAGIFVAYLILKKVGKKPETQKIEYKPINLEIETPLVMAKLNRIIKNTGVIVHSVDDECSPYPDFSEAGEWPKVQYYYFKGQKRDGSFVKVECKQGVISREIQKWKISKISPEKTKFHRSGEVKYPFIKSQTPTTPLYEPTKAKIELVTADQTQTHETSQENGE